MKEEDPRRAMVKQLWGPLAGRLRLGESSHARPNLEYALLMSVDSGYSAKWQAEFLRDSVDHIIKPQFREGILAELMRLRASVLAKYPPAAKE